MGIFCPRFIIEQLEIEHILHILLLVEVYFSVPSVFDTSSIVACKSPSHLSLLYACLCA